MGMFRPTIFHNLACLLDGLCMLQFVNIVHVRFGEIGLLLEAIRLAQGLA
jgi:hypothetical protein